MGGKATLVARVLEAVRQRDLTNRLGQVTCETFDVHADLDQCVTACDLCTSGSWPLCPACKAVV